MIEILESLSTNKEFRMKISPLTGVSRERDTEDVMLMGKSWSNTEAESQWD